MANNKSRSRGVGFFVLIIVLAIFAWALKPFIIITPGHAGVVVRLGKLAGVYEPGFHWKIPVADKIVIYNTRLLTYETSDNPAESMADYTDYPVDTSTKDGQPIHIRYTVRFKVDPTKLADIYASLGSESRIVERIIKTDSRINVRVIAREFAAQDLYSGNVLQFERRVADVLRENFAQKGIILDYFGVRGIEFSQDYVEAVEQKQIEKERVMAEKYKAEQELYKKQARITQAQAEAEAQKLLQQSLTKQVLERMWIEKWDGKLPQVTSDSGLILSLDDLK